MLRRPGLDTAGLAAHAPGVGSVDTRDVDWPLIEGALAIRPTVHEATGGRVEELVLLSRRLRSGTTLLDYGFRLLGGLKAVLELERLALFLRSKSGRWLCGLVGTTADGRLIDERHLRHAVDPCDEELWSDLMNGRRSFERIDNAPLIAHEGEDTCVIGRGWLVKTPIVVDDEPLGLLYNDCGFSGASFDRETQELVAAFLLLVAPTLRLIRDRAAPVRDANLSKTSSDCLELLTADPRASNDRLAQQLGCSSNRLGRVFQDEMGMSLSDYRNELRLQRFFTLAGEMEHERKHASLVQLALQAGFGSYSQFHRVFSTRFGRSPKRYLGS